MEVHYDSEADAISVWLRNGKSIRTQELDLDRLVDYDAEGHVLGVEFLFVSKGINLEGVPCADLVAEALRGVPHPVA